jgi:hypothetical protein
MCNEIKILKQVVEGVDVYYNKNEFRKYRVEFFEDIMIQSSKPTVVELLDFKFRNSHNNIDYKTFNNYIEAKNLKFNDYFEQDSKLYKFDYKEGDIVNFHNVQSGVGYTMGNTSNVKKVIKKSLLIKGA